MRNKVNRSRKNAKRKLAKKLRAKINITEVETFCFVKYMTGSATSERGMMKEKK